LSGEFALGAAGEFNRNLFVLRAIDLRRLQSLDEIDRLGDALLELGDARLDVGEGRQIDAGDASTSTGGMVRRLSYLAR
jgi:hypothetical protein